MANEEQIATAPFMSAGSGTMQFPHDRNLYPYKFVMARILNHSCVTLNLAYK
jgi:hypothetical protein